MFFSYLLASVGTYWVVCMSPNSEDWKKFRKNHKSIEHNPMTFGWGTDIRRYIGTQEGYRYNPSVPGLPTDWESKESENK